MVSNECRLLGTAIRFASTAHNDQIDKAGQAYILHPIRVMCAMQPYGVVAMIAAVLHDVVEDCGVGLPAIENFFGLEVAEIVDAVSRRKGETYRAYIERASKHPIARQLKIKDIEDNSRPERAVPSLVGMQKRHDMALKILEAEGRN